MAVILETIASGDCRDGWQDVTCLFDRYQEQHNRSTGEFRHRPIAEVLVAHPNNKTVRAYMAARQGDPWIEGPSPDTRWRK